MIQEAVNRLTDKNKNNFNLIRLLATVGVIITHSYALLGKPENDFLARLSNGLLSFSRLGVYTFFIISGFLITQSLERSSSIFSFYWKRFLRIFPALFVVIFLSVFVLGFFLTDLNFGEYFKNPITYRYLGGVTLYRLTFDLPGVFKENPLPSTVNGSLWTLPYEWTCYFFLSCLVLLVKKRKNFLLLSSFFLLMFARWFWRDNLDKMIPILLINLNHLLNYSLFFFSGIVAYVYKDLLKFSWPLALLCIFLIFINSTKIWGIYILYCLLAYLILYLAIIKLPWQNFLVGRDYSYGLYIWAFPVQQILVKFFFPGLNIYTLAFLTFLCTMPLAILSWHLIEKPCLKFK